MEKPKLVILTGYPSSGKSTLSKYLAKNMGYKILSGDMIAEELFGHGYPFKENENPEKIWETIYQRRDELLKEGENVVIDTTAYNNDRRNKLFETKAEKYLVWLKISPEKMDERIGERKWTKESVDKWKKEINWEDPKEGNYNFLSYKNEKPEDLDKIKSDLKKKLI